MATSATSVRLQTSPLHRFVLAFRRPVVLDSLTLLLIVCQVLDGIATAVGLSRFGTGLEGNILLREGMKLCGVVPTLLVAKSAAIAMVIGLRRLRGQVVWVGEALLILSVIYMSAALIPWMIILIER